MGPEPCAQAVWVLLLPPAAQGTADAIRQYAWLLDEAKLDSIEDVLILSGDHLYNMVRRRWLALLCC